MSFGLQNGVIAPTPTGRIDSAFLDGNDGSDVTPSWSASQLNLSTLQVGTTLSIDLAANGFFTDPGSPSSELGFNFVSGQPALAAGFSLSGTVLSNNCTLATSGAFRLVAVRNGISVLSSIIAFVISAPVASVDNVAPTVPTGITAVPGTTVGTIAVTCDAPSDVAPGATPASGTAHVNILVNGVISPPSPIVTAANSLASPSIVNIGSMTISPAVSQSGKAWTASAEGSGIASTSSEQCLFYPFGQYSGAHQFCAKLDPYTSSASTALNGLMVHETGVAGGKFVAIGLRPSNGTVGLYVITRTTSSGTSSQVATQLKDINGQSIIGPIYVFIARAADGKTWTISYSLNELGRNQITVQTLSMNASVFYGGFLTSQSAGTTVTANLEEVSITSGVQLSANVTASSPVSIQFQSVDVAGNTSALSTAIQGVPKVASTGGTLRSNFGFYGCFDYSGGVNANRFANGDSAVIAAASTDDNITGYAFIITYRSIDQGTTGPSYVYTVIDQYVNACRSAGKQYWIWVNPTAFASSGASITTGSKCVPDWLINSVGLQACMGNYSLGGARQVGAGTYIKWYTTAVKNAFLAMMQALINRYGSDPFCEGFAFCIGTANAVANAVDSLGTKQPSANYDTDYSDTGMINGWLSLFPALRAMSSTQNFWFTTDYLFNMAGSASYTGQDVQWTAIFDAAVQNKIVLGGVDSWTQNWIYPQTPFTPTGQNAYATSTNPNYRRSVYSDQIYRGWRGPTPGVGNGYRGKIRYAGCEELTEMGGYIGQFSAADVWLTKGPNLDNCHYMFFDCNITQAGNYGTDPNVTSGAPKAPNTLWDAGTRKAPNGQPYETVYGPSVKTWIKTAGKTNQVDPYT